MVLSSWANISKWRFSIEILFQSQSSRKQFVIKGSCGCSTKCVLFFEFETLRIGIKE